MIRNKIFLMLTLFSLLAYNTFAQDSNVAKERQAQLDGWYDQISIPEGNPDIISCFDYYKFGSVNAELTSSVASTISGGVIDFSGNLINENDYPIIDGQLHVKIVRDRGLKVNDGNGPDVLDEFTVKENINIPAKGKYQVGFNWKVPAYAISGEYKLVTFFTTSHRYNFLGLSFTDDVVGNAVPFSVVGESKDIVKFEKSGVTINDQKYLFAAYPPEIKQPSTTISAKVVNTSTSTQSVEIDWEMYKWDSKLNKNLLDQQQTTVTVPGNSSIPVNLKITNNESVVYYVVGKLAWKDTKSQIGVRYYKKDKNEPRLGFAGILNYPLEKGKENTLFSCVNNTGASPSIPSGKVEITLKTLDGEVIDSYTYEGKVTEAMMAVQKKFVPQSNYSSFILNTKLYNEGKLLDSVDVKYKCSDLSRGDCTDVSGIVEAPLNESSNKSANIYILIFGGILAILLLAIGVWVMLNKKEVTQNNPVNQINTSDK